MRVFWMENIFIIFMRRFLSLLRLGLVEVTRVIEWQGTRVRDQVLYNILYIYGGMFIMDRQNVHYAIY